MERHICIHGHFYQPPRENPWLEAVELQDSAYPDHDWNERITSECYGPNSQSRILDSEGRITAIDNSYSKISFNFGPTLLSWMQKNDPEAYQNILNADRESRKRFSGHGSALAQAYNHMIMPLANTRDERTQIYWGIKDFESRFGRRPEGMWLPETAANTETLELLAEYGIRFTVLAPNQAKRVRKIGDKKWRDVTDSRIDPQKAYRCHLPSGKELTLFFYDGPISQELAFGDLLKDGVGFANRLLGVFPKDAKGVRLVHIATDGETYGHHHRYGDMALAYCLHHIETQGLARITVYGEFLERHPPTDEVEIIDDTSWSCVHGIERWKSDCGCHSGMNPDWHQQWRKPLRDALDWLRDSYAGIFESQMREMCDDPWKARDEYIHVILDRSPSSVLKYFQQNMNKELDPGEKVKALKLLEAQRHAMLMYTSCGWFFDDISGIESTQVVQYAARVIQLTRELTGINLEENFCNILAMAPSNVAEYGNGRMIYETQIKPTMIDLKRVGAHYAVSSLFEEYPQDFSIYCYSARSEQYDRFESGKQKLIFGKARIRSDITWEEEAVNFAVLHLGDHNLTGGVKGPVDEKVFARMEQEIREVFKKNDIPRTIRLIEKHFEEGHYSLWHLFKDEQSKILLQILDTTLQEIEVSLRQIKEHHYPIFQVVKQLRIPLPKVLTNTVLVMLNKDILECLAQEDIHFGRLSELVSEVKEWGLEIDRETIGFIARRKIDAIMDRVRKEPDRAGDIIAVQNLLKTLAPLALKLDLWKAQNCFFSVAKGHYAEKREEATAGEEKARQWLEAMRSLGGYLRVKTE